MHPESCYYSQVGQNKQFGAAKRYVHGQNTIWGKPLLGANSWLCSSLRCLVGSMVAEYLAREPEGSGESATHIIPVCSSNNGREQRFTGTPQSYVNLFPPRSIIGTRLFSSLYHLDNLKRLCYTARVRRYYNI